MKAPSVQSLDCDMSSPLLWFSLTENKLHYGLISEICSGVFRVPGTNVFGPISLKRL